jgi:hypothetical protein
VRSRCARAATACGWALSSILGNIRNSQYRAALRPWLTADTAIRKGPNLLPPSAASVHGLKAKLTADGSDQFGDGGTIWRLATAGRFRLNLLPGLFRHWNAGHATRITVDDPPLGSGFSERTTRFRPAAFAR